VKQLVISLALVAAVLPGAASADTITFSTGTPGSFTGPAVEGYLGGVLQGTDSLVTSSTNLVHTTLASVNLNGVTIDELRVILDASSASPSWEGTDNIVVTRVPEPTSIVLVAAGLVALHSRRRIRRRG